MKLWRAVARLLALIGHVWRGLRVIQRDFPAWDGAARERAIQDWSRQALSIFGLQCRVQGEWPASGPVLMVSNHISWLDILVINAARPARFVSKADVRDWSLLGRLVEGSGTVFIERERRRDALRVVHHLAEHLKAGEVLAVFPEGTTGDGRTVLPFHANLLQAAVATDAPVLPVGIAYRHTGSDQRHDAPTYIGDTTLLQSVWRTLCADDLEVVVSCGLLDRAQGRDRRTWSAALRQEIATMLDLPIDDEGDRQPS